MLDEGCAWIRMGSRYGTVTKRVHLWVHKIAQRHVVRRLMCKRKMLH